jgi:hypothetical protein
MPTDHLLPNGLNTYTMHCGFPIAVRILTGRVMADAWMGNEYLVESTGPSKLVDLGQNWVVNPGDTFTTRDCNITRANAILNDARKVA